MKYIFQTSHSMYFCYEGYSEYWLNSVLFFTFLIGFSYLIPSILVILYKKIIDKSTISYLHYFTNINFATFFKQLRHNINVFTTNTTFETILNHGIITTTIHLCMIIKRREFIIEFVFVEPSL